MQIEGRTCLLGIFRDVTEHMLIPLGQQKGVESLSVPRLGMLELRQVALLGHRGVL